MSSNLARNPFIKILYEYRHVAFLVLIYAAEMTVWAVLNLKGLGDEDFSTWRIFLLVSVGVIAGSAGILDDPDDGWMVYAGALTPWLIAPFVVIVYGFIQMNLQFLSMEWFFTCVLLSFSLQFLVIFLNRFSF
ncbi:hypothetical protein RJ218_003879 [Enterobacter hormaechei]|uniref:Uncharacterized protein n=1 Tax=Citrobacter freundii TaxID=546 RepID=A0ABY7L7D3_CITFR|nr:MULTISPECIES: hypothetical protein [Enterobacteriaceae]ELK7442723.1 hypothetical protein [Enterobacter cloacae]HED3823582.1 hypothetical protein [Enterobacter hormaechei subsp. oharae]EIJ9085030.1 hypothetical protein [Citrobacter freundii]EKS6346618.1 hypothetical protein [Enterobacter hormaechei]EKX7629451.1 hypothetical protein [Enterobacter mori]